MIARRIVVVMATAILLGVAAVAVATAPDSSRITEPFYANGAVGRSVNTRLLDVEVRRVAFARELTVSYGGTFDQPETVYPSDAVWVVIDVTATSSTDSLILAGSILTVGEYSYSAFALPSPTIESFTVGSDVPVEGTLVFEIPTSVYESAVDARVTLKGNFSMPLEQIAVVVVPFAGSTVEPSITVDPAVVEGVER